ncbi:acylneuraminate cytidylyltransferase family protein [uncultured Algimonas sp.]|uniref:acylneuraminate cytidylyltransferase family protein n=1 Tax=uncultured Algimonas sp. TaxID=1547920 RepID=UPI002607EEB3|nr:acylneuraminate cytidylyltransferase family protein [uncultured Algimonas sp.]
MSVIPAIIPARGGSVRLPGKNLMEIDGRSLIQIAIEAAAPVIGLDNIYVSTDHEPTKAEARRHGAGVIDRPEHLSGSTATAKAAALHALDILGNGYDRFVYLQPTSPLRLTQDIRACVDLFETVRCHTVVSVTESEVTPGRFWAKRKEIMEPYFEAADPFKRRQEQEKAYVPNGAVYVCDRESFLASEKSSFLMDPTYAYEMPHHRSIDIDTDFDLTLARVWMEKALADEGTDA